MARNPENKIEIEYRKLKSLANALYREYDKKVGVVPKIRDGNYKEEVMKEIIKKTELETHDSTFFKRLLPEKSRTNHPLTIIEISEKYIAAFVQYLEGKVLNHEKLLKKIEEIYVQEQGKPQPVAQKQGLSIAGVYVQFWMEVTLSAVQKAIFEIFADGTATYKMTYDGTQYDTKGYFYQPKERVIIGKFCIDKNMPKGEFDTVFMLMVKNAGKTMEGVISGIDPEEKSPFARRVFFDKLAEGTSYQETAPQTYTKPEISEIWQQYPKLKEFFLGIKDRPINYTETPDFYEKMKEVLG